MFKIGLKLWSTNTDYYYSEAQKLYDKKVFDYIELFVVPDTLKELQKWKKLEIPFVLHAPHFALGVNLADKNKFDFNYKIYQEVEQYAQELKSKYTIVHCGFEGTIEEAIRQLKIIKPSDFIVENKPYIAPRGERKLCRGSSIQEISKVIQETKCGFCLDIGHAICAANSMGYEPYSYLEKFNKLKPLMYHISSGEETSPIDKHWHINQGNFNFKKICALMLDNTLVSVETNKDSKTDLNDFIEDSDRIKEFLKR